MQNSAKILQIKILNCGVNNYYQKCNVLNHKVSLKQEYKKYINSKAET